MTAPCFLDPTQANESVNTGSLGSLYAWEGGEYVWVHNAGADAIAAGDVVCWFLTTPAAGHVSVTGATALDNGTAGMVAGVAVGAISAGSYGFLLVRGITTVGITTDGAVAKGDRLVVNGGTTPDGTVDTMADGEEECVFATALDDDSSTTLSLTLVHAW